MIRRSLLLALVALAAPSAGGAAARPAVPVRVSLETTAGTIVIALEMQRAPITAANFLHYVELKRFDDTTFYRAARTRGASRHGFIQGGVRKDIRRVLSPIPHEPTSRTGLSHVDGTISMARNAPGTAMGDFFITVGALPSMDAHPARRSAKQGDSLGFAAFGHVVGGMDVVRRILAAPTVPNVGDGVMRGQMIAAPVRIIAARRAK